VSSLPADLSYSSVVWVPIGCLVCVLLVASIIHSSLHSLLAELLRELNWTPTEVKTRTEIETCFIWNSLYDLTDHTENIPHGCYCWNVCTNHFIATVAVLTIVNPLLLLYPATRSKNSFFYCCVPFEVSMASTVTAWGKHATICYKHFSCCWFL
jgi:hypothetical protein